MEDQWLPPFLWSDAPQLSLGVSRMLKSVPHPDLPSDEALIPAAVVLRDGTRVERVAFMEFERYQRKWGPSKGRTFVDANEVVDVTVSASQLPASFANQIYKGGMNDRYRFTMTTKDGSRFYYLVGGDVLDFIKFPTGYTRKDIKSVEVGWMPRSPEWYSPEHGSTPEGKRVFEERERKALHGLSYSWCLYSE